jgi:hypothetical protein
MTSLDISDVIEYVPVSLTLFDREVIIESITKIQNSPGGIYDEIYNKMLGQNLSVVMHSYELNIERTTEYKSEFGNNIIQKLMVSSNNDILYLSLHEKCFILKALEETTTSGISARIKEKLSA